MFTHSAKAALPAAILLALLAACGCAKLEKTDHVVHGSTPAALKEAPWGPTMALVRLELPEHAKKQAEKEVEVRDIVEKAVAERSGGPAIPPERIAEALGDRDFAALGEVEIIAAAKRAGAETVVLVRLGRYQGYLHIDLLPPGIATETDMEYSVRVLDVATGAARLDARRGLRSGGAFRIRGSEDLRRDLAGDLATVLAGDAPALSQARP